MTTADDVLEAARSFLREKGLLLLSDPELPCLVRMVTGEAPSGSWWSHPRGGLVYRVAGALDDEADLVSAKLVAAKVTWVHRRLWPALVGLGTSGEPWQTEGLAKGAVAVLGALTRHPSGQARVDQLSGPGLPKGKALGDACRALEERLLCHSASVHTEGGKHLKELSTWKAWSRAIGFKEAPLGSRGGRKVLEEAARSLAPAGPLPRLPWNVARREP